MKNFEKFMILISDLDQIIFCLAEKVGRRFYYSRRKCGNSVGWRLKRRIACLIPVIFKAMEAEE